MTPKTTKPVAPVSPAPSPPAAQHTPLEKAIAGFGVILKVLEAHKLTLTPGEFSVLTQSREDLRLYLLAQHDAASKK